MFECNCNDNRRDKLALRTTCIKNVKFNYQNKERLSVCRILLLQRKPQLGRTKPSTGPHTGLGLDIADLGNEKRSTFAFQFLNRISSRRFFFRLSEFFFYPLLGRARFRGRYWTAIRLSHRQEPSGRAVHGEDIGGRHGRHGGLFFCATLTGRRGGHNPFVQVGAETSDTGAETVKPDPGSSWEGHSRG